MRRPDPQAARSTIVRWLRRSQPGHERLIHWQGPAADSSRTAPARVYVTQAVRHDLQAIGNAPAENLLNREERSLASSECCLSWRRHAFHHHITEQFARIR